MAPQSLSALTRQSPGETLSAGGGVGAPLAISHHSKRCLLCPAGTSNGGPILHLSAR